MNNNLAERFFSLVEFIAERTKNKIKEKRKLKRCLNS
jgi:hypothetical protein